MEPEEGIAYLKSLLGKQLRMHITDGRMFRGEFKCTDSEGNAVLADSYEYRAPTGKAVTTEMVNSKEGFVKADMRCRYVGLIVVPGHLTRKIELEKEAIQVM